jgi:hypothetical protein
MIQLYQARPTASIFKHSVVHPQITQMTQITLCEKRRTGVCDLASGRKATTWVGSPFPFVICDIRDICGLSLPPPPLSV